MLRAQVSYIEIYQDEIRDLLATGAAAGAPIVLRESAARGVTPENVKCGPPLPLPVNSACRSCTARHWLYASQDASLFVPGYQAFLSLGRMLRCGSLHPCACLVTEGGVAAAGRWRCAARRTSRACWRPATCTARWPRTTSTSTARVRALTGPPPVRVPVLLRICLIATQGGWFCGHHMALLPRSHVRRTLQPLVVYCIYFWLNGSLATCEWALE